MPVLSKGYSGAGVVFVVAVLGGCGGGTGGGTGGSEGAGASGGTRGAALRGVFTDSPVAGVSYETETRSGVTDAEGGFAYEPGETVTFRAGDVVLGSVEAKPEVSPFDLVPGATPVTRTPRIVDALMLDRRFQQVVNLTVFVQSLDADDDPNNGIEITADVAALFEGADIDFELRTPEFLRAFAFRSRIGRAHTEGLFAEPHGITTPSRAMSHLYDTLGIDPLIFAPATLRVDVDIDQSDDFTRAYSYDGRGRPMRVIQDHGVLDGSVDMEYTWAYDRNWNVTRYREEGSRPDPFVILWTFDALGNRASKSEDAQGDDDPEKSEWWEHDANGNEVRYARDSDGDEAPEYVEIRTYDDEGRWIRNEVDSPADDTVDDTTFFEYDDRGNRVRIERDFGADESIDRITTFEYDAAGNQTSVMTDSDADGTIDAITTYAYDGGGNQTLDERDDGADGDVDFRWAATRDDAGRLTMVEVDTDGDDEVDSRTTWDYDDDGNLIRFTRDDGPNGVPERVTTWVYDENGSPIEWQRLTTESGLRNQLRVRTFTPAGWKLVMAEALISADGNFVPFD